MKFSLALLATVATATQWHKCGSKPAKAWNGRSVKCSGDTCYSVCKKGNLKLEIKGTVLCGKRPSSISAPENIEETFNKYIKVGNLRAGPRSNVFLMATVDIPGPLPVDSPNVPLVIQSMNPSSVLEFS